MLKPSDIDLSSVKLNSHRLVKIEESFDEAIRRAQKSGEWPARVDNARDTASDAEVEHVADRYRAEGWKVVTGQRGERALIDHPDRKR